jgi:hypothetical protein
VGGVGIAEILSKRPGVFIDMRVFLNGIHGTDLNPQAAATFIAGILIYNAIKVLKVNRMCRTVRMATSTTHAHFLVDNHAFPS